jgi:hypothetical protein
MYVLHYLGLAYDGVVSGTMKGTGADRIGIASTVDCVIVYRFQWMRWQVLGNFRTVPVGRRV